MGSVLGLWRNVSVARPLDRVSSVVPICFRQLGDHIDVLTFVQALDGLAECPRYLPGVGGSCFSP
jgi:hypothetical protein